MQAISNGFRADIQVMGSEVKAEVGAGLVEAEFEGNQHTGNHCMYGPMQNGNVGMRGTRKECGLCVGHAARNGGWSGQG